MSYKHKWFDPELTIANLEELLGAKVVSLTKGFIETGEFRIRPEDGTPIPIRKRGIEVELENKPSDVELVSLDKKMKGFKRTEAVERDLEAEIDDLKARLDGLEAK